MSTVVWCYSGSLCCDVILPQAPSDWASKNPKVQRAENESRVFIMKAGILLIPRLKREKGRNKERKKSLRGFRKGGITDLAFEVLCLSVLFVVVEYSVLLRVQFRLEGFASWIKQHFYYPSNKVCSEGFTLCPSFSSARKRNVMQGCGKQCRAVG